MSEVDKILKDAAKIADELYPTYGHVQTPIEVLSFYRQKSPRLHRDDLWAQRALVSARRQNGGI